ncbi:hypothetical protein MNBD_GAMMA06-528 [hydrothermal vent metagenome]|uniref:GAF domain-containing protein n=1 Tax=hydrothermal vent metagenome TaxID=652676 RepID=A0A3B0XDI2_9ZZZZ
MNKTIKKTNKIKPESKLEPKSKAKEISDEREQQLATELQLISLLRENPDILIRHPELLTVIEVSHQSGSAVSLIERQVTALREQIEIKEKRLVELMDVARDNQRLAKTSHRLAIDLLATHDVDDVISIVLDTFKTELSADHAVVKLFSEDTELIEQSAGLFVDVKDGALKAFKTMLQHKNTVCGKSTKEQKIYMFEEKAEQIKSVAIIPLIAGANLGLIGLGAENVQRFNASMGTEFLAHVGELVSASLAGHLEN